MIPYDFQSSPRTLPLNLGQVEFGELSCPAVRMWAKDLERQVGLVIYAGNHLYESYMK